MDLVFCASLCAAQIADFGLAAIRQDPEELLHTECGTRSYMAPEILGHKVKRPRMP